MMVVMVVVVMVMVVMVVVTMVVRMMVVVVMMVMMMVIALRCAIVSQGPPFGGGDGVLEAHSGATVGVQHAGVDRDSSPQVQCE